MALGHEDLSGQWFDGLACRSPFQTKIVQNVSKGHFAESSEAGRRDS